MPPCGRIDAPDLDAPCDDETPTSTREIDARIAAQLRAAFADVLDEPVPDRFIVLLEKLAKAEEL